MGRDDKYVAWPMDQKVNGDQRFYIVGPGLGMYSQGLDHLTKEEAETLCRALARAYEAGKGARSKEILDMLGGVCWTKVR